MAPTLRPTQQDSRKGLDIRSGKAEQVNYPVMPIRAPACPSCKNKKHPNRRFPSTNGPQPLAPTAVVRPASWQAGRPAKPPSPDRSSESLLPCCPARRPSGGGPPRRSELPAWPPLRGREVESRRAPLLRTNVEHSQKGGTCFRFFAVGRRVALVHATGITRLRQGRVRSHLLPPRRTGLP